MRLEIRQLGDPSDALRELTRRQVERALGPFRTSVAHVEVRIEDVNGPRGGVDQRCSILVDLVPLRRKLVVRRTRSDPYEAVRAACGHLHESVSRALTRRRQLDRAPTPKLAGAPVGSSGPVPEQRERMAGQIKVTTLDQKRLASLIDAAPDGRDREAIAALADELGHADVFEPERIAGNVVTMNSRVVFQDVETGERHEVTLVYPPESAPERGRISVLAPIGTALLGLAVGETIDWPLPRGRAKRLRIVEILYQPEEAGHLHL
jgi:regulator of nucleoside diphosphate kinase